MAKITQLRSRYTHTQKITKKGLIVLNGNIENKASIVRLSFFFLLFLEEIKEIITKIFTAYV